MSSTAHQSGLVVCNVWLEYSMAVMSGWIIAKYLQELGLRANLPTAEVCLINILSQLFIVRSSFTFII
jgi:hypothetical protein